MVKGKLLDGYLYRIESDTFTSDKMQLGKPNAMRAFMGFSPSCFKSYYSTSDVIQDIRWLLPPFSCIRLRERSGSMALFCRACFEYESSSMHAAAATLWQWHKTEQELIDGRPVKWVVSQREEVSELDATTTTRYFLRLDTAEYTEKANTQTCCSSFFHASLNFEFPG